MNTLRRRRATGGWIWSVSRMAGSFTISILRTFGQKKTQGQGKKGKERRKIVKNMELYSFELMGGVGDKKFWGNFEVASRQTRRFGFRSLSPISNPLNLFFVECKDAYGRWPWSIIHPKFYLFSDSSVQIQTQDQEKILKAERFWTSVDITKLILQ